MVGLKDRIVRLLRLYQFDISKGKFETLASEIQDHFQRRGRKPRKRLIKETLIGNIERFVFIRKAQKRLQEHPFYIPPEITATVVTEMLSYLRHKGNFEDVCRELWEVSKITCNEEAEKITSFNLIDPAV